MPVQPSYPGVYVQEVASGVRTITGVSTSIALFVGMTKRGRLSKPRRILGFSDYERAFGTDTTAGEMTDQVRQFFLNGGQQAWITRIADGAEAASVHLRDSTRAHRVLTVTAKDAGLDGNQIRVEVDYSTPGPESTFNLTVFREIVNPSGKLEVETVQTFANLTMDPNDGRFAENVVNQQSTLVDVRVEKDTLPPVFAGYSISGILFHVAENSIIAIDGTAETITVAGDQTLAYPDGMAISVSGSGLAANNRTFNVIGTSFNPPNTVISTDGDLADEGNVNAVVSSIPTLASDINVMINAGNNTIRMKVDDGAFRTIVLPPLVPTANFAAWQQVLDAAFPGPGVTVSLTDPLPAGGDPKSRFLKFQSTNTNGGGIIIEKSLTNDLAVPLQLGIDQGGLEVDGRANQRPAPTGFFADLGDLTAATGPAALAGFANAEQAEMTEWTLSDTSGNTTSYSGNPQPIAFPGSSVPGSRMYNGTAFINVTVAMVGSLRNVQENLSFLGSQIEGTINGTDGAWTAALQGHRLVLKPTFGDVDSDTTASLNSGPGYDIGANAEPFNSTPGPASVQANVKAYRLGGPGTGEYQENGNSGEDGTFPKLADYEAVFPDIDREVDLFNLMILPRAVDQRDTIRQSVWGPASIFCQQRRAFLLIDPLSDIGAWSDVNAVTAHPTGGVNGLRAGLVNDHAALYWPRVSISVDGSTKPIDPSGAIAGLMARTDSNRGVWKAPAGLEATIRGVRGVEYPMSDRENGIINQEAVNAIRVFPNGIVSWGARTMAGFRDDDYKYIPVRRLALFIEESLYRGLKFAVFEPNDEPLWAQIRLAAGAFMNNLFRQGAFQGQKASDAYLVKVDSETTTQNDINLGIVNVVIGFAPLKPAEFVIITIQQLAGQVQV